MKWWSAFLLAAASCPGAEVPVSFHNDVRPIFQANCNACHRAGKAKGGLDLTSVAAIKKGGKHGAAIEVGKADGSRLMEDIGGDEPTMPDEGEPLTAEEVALIGRWIAGGAIDDSPVAGAGHHLTTPPVYRSLPSIAALAWSPDGEILAVAGHHEVVLHRGDGSGIIGRLVGESPTIQSLAWSPDGRLLAVGGGAMAEYGEIQLWDAGARSLVRSIRASGDVVFGISFSPDGTRVAVGCADKLVRAFAVADGVEVMRCDNHMDWVFGTAWTLDGKRLVSASRDRALKLIDTATGLLIDDIAIPREPLLALARHPAEDQIVSGSDAGQLRVFRAAPREGRLSEGDNKEASFIRELDRLPGAIQALAWSSDGKLIAAGSKTETRLYSGADGKRVATLKGVESTPFALAFHPREALVAAAGYDGKVRFFDTVKGEFVRAFDPVPLGTADHTVAR